MRNAVVRMRPSPVQRGIVTSRWSAVSRGRIFVKEFHQKRDVRFPPAPAQRDKSARFSAGVHSSLGVSRPAGVFQQSRPSQGASNRLRPGPFCPGRRHKTQAVSFSSCSQIQRTSSGPPPCPTVIPAPPAAPSENSGRWRKHHSPTETIARSLPPAGADPQGRIA